MMEKYDVAVLGAGPGGYETAIRCAQYGLNTVLIEARELGGTCLNRGCIPTKALLQGAHAYETIETAGKYGLEIGKAAMDYSRLSLFKDTVVNQMVRGIGALEKAHGVTLVKGYGVVEDTHTIVVGDEKIEAEKIILATGSEPAKPSIPGIEGKNVFDSDGILAMTKAPDSMVIIGGGVIGMEFATLYSTLGKKVTVLEMMPEILPGVELDIVKMLKRSLKGKGVDVITHARVMSIEGGETVKVIYSLNGEELCIEAQVCAVCAGRKPNTQSIGLEDIGIDMERGFIVVDDTMCTNVENIYAIGDITGKMQLAHVATAQGFVAAAVCAGRKAVMEYEVLPACIYTDPEIAYVGLSEVQANDQGYEVITGSFNAATNGKAMIMGATCGVCKLVADQASHRILGVQIMAPRATDILAEAAVVMKFGGTIEDLVSVVHPHPTVSEIVLEAAHDAEGLCCNTMPRRR